jgi:hypothetical protein
MKLEKVALMPVILIAVAFMPSVASAPSGEVAAPQGSSEGIHTFVQGEYACKDANFCNLCFLSGLAICLALAGTFVGGSCSATDPDGQVCECNYTCITPQPLDHVIVSPQAI